MKIIAGTGPRPKSIGGYNLPNPTYIRICQEIQAILLEEKPDKIISGMAQGFDSWLANIAIKLNIPFIAAVPFVGQEAAWSEKDQIIYRRLLSKAEKVVIVSDGGYQNFKFHKRNEFMVDSASHILACYNQNSTGGTASCIKYALPQNKPIIYISPDVVDLNTKEN
jgi:uncharacterized phage-like protein YoqJ